MSALLEDQEKPKEEGKQEQEDGPEGPEGSEQGKPSATDNSEPMTSEEPQ
jgi:hypothetical protein